MFNIWEGRALRPLAFLIFPVFLIWFILSVAEASAVPVGDCDHESVKCSQFHGPSVTDDAFGGGMGTTGWGAFKPSDQFWGGNTL
jgi:hypothetical protein